VELEGVWKVLRKEGFGGIFSKLFWRNLKREEGGFYFGPKLFSPPWIYSPNYWLCWKLLRREGYFWNPQELIRKG